MRRVVDPPWLARGIRRVPATGRRPRQCDAEGRPRKSDAVYRAARRGASRHMRARIQKAAATLGAPDRPEAMAIRQARETRRALERGWLATSEALRSQGETRHADQTQRFVQALPPARTEREWLRAEEVERAQDRERTR